MLIFQGGYFVKTLTSYDYVTLLLLDFGVLLLHLFSVTNVTIFTGMFFVVLKPLYSDVELVQKI